MEKRLILAVALSSVILFMWSASLPKPPLQPTPRLKAELSLTEQPAAPKLFVEEKPVASPSLLSFNTRNAEVIFEENSAAIQEVSFKDFQAYKFSLYSGFALKNMQGFKQDKITSEAISFVQKDNEKEVIKTFNFSNHNYFIELRIEIKNLSNLPLKMSLPLSLGAILPHADPNQTRYQDFTVALPDKLLHPNTHKDNYLKPFKFIGLRERYFCAIIEPSSSDYAAVIKKVDAKKSELGVESGDILIAPGQSVLEKFRIYLGPQRLGIITSINPNWAVIVHYGTFDFISQILLQLLDIFHKLTHNWGWAIILLSLAVYLVLFPLTLKQMRSMKEMQLLQPRIEELRKTHKDNPQRLNKEIMELYREHKVNPLGGCLPLILQMPIFFALYQALMRSLDLKGAKFLWIKDLSEPDKLAHLPVSLPILGNEVNILPLLMTVGMFVQQKITMTASPSSGSAEQQKIMLILFPLMFGLIFYHMPAGLVLYWFINSSLMLFYQIKMVKQNA